MGSIVKVVMCPWPALTLSVIDDEKRRQEAFHKKMDIKRRVHLKL